MGRLSISGNIVDLQERRIFPGTVVVQNGSILSIAPTTDISSTHYILPGFIDAHAPGLRGPDLIRYISAGISSGTNDADLCNAVNAVIENKGGIAIAANGKAEVLPLPVAGIMSPEDGYRVAQKYSMIDQKAKQLGSTLHAPFMTLSFMALLVIPSLKLSDKGLFDGSSFSFTFTPLVKT